MNESEDVLINTTGKENCKITLESQKNRVIYFIKRMSERIDASPQDVVIVLINVDSLYGRSLAEHLMPGHDWQQYRDIGETPFARGLASREGMQNVVDYIDKKSANKLRSIDGIAVVVIDHDIAAVFSENELP